MNTLRNELKRSYSQIPNDLITDLSISNGALRVLLYLFTKPDDWSVYNKDICKQLDICEDTLTKYWKELLNSNWLKREQKRDSGAFSGYFYSIGDYRNEKIPNRENTDTEKVRDGKSSEYNNNNIPTNTKDLNNTKDNIKPNGSNAHFAVDVINHLNFVANTKYKHNIKKTVDLIAARRKEGFTLEDFKTVIDKKCAEWLNSDMAKYLRPETLFGNKFESYLNSVTSQPKQTLAERMIVSDKIKSALEMQGINMSDVYDGTVKIDGLSWEVVPYMGGTRYIVAYNKPIDSIDAEVL